MVKQVLLLLLLCCTSLCVMGQGKKLRKAADQVSAMQKAKLWPQSLQTADSILALDETNRHPWFRMEVLFMRMQAISYTKEDALWLNMSTLDSEAVKATFPLQDFYWLACGIIAKKGVSDHYSTTPFPDSPWYGMSLDQLSHRGDSLLLLAMSRLDQLLRVPLAGTGLVPEEDLYLTKNFPSLGDLVMEKILEEYSGYAFHTHLDWPVGETSPYWEVGEPFYRAMLPLTPDSISIPALLRSCAIREAHHQRKGETPAWIEAVFSRLDVMSGNWAQEETGNYHRAMATFASMLEGYPDWQAYAMAVDAERYVHGSVSGEDRAGEQQRLSTALEIVSAALNRKGNGSGAMYCRDLESSLLEPSFTFTLPVFVEPLKPFPLFTRYRNAEWVHFRIVSAGRAFADLDPDADNDRLLALFSSSPAAAEWTDSLPHDMPLISSSAYLSAPALPRGKYFIIAEAYNSSGSKPLLTSVNMVEVRDAELVVQARPDGGNDIWVFNPWTGRPLQDALLRVLEPERVPNQEVTNENGSTTSPIGLREVAVFPVSAEGLAQIPFPGPEIGTDFNLEVLLPGDSFLFEISPGNVTFARPKPPRTVNWKGSKVETDRGIYKPGQDLYYSTLSWEVNPKDWSIHTRKGDTIPVKLLDASGKEVGQAKSVTGEMGSTDGFFHLPENMLPGTYSLKVPGYKKSVSVAWYRRPVINLRREGVPVLSPDGKELEVKLRATYQSGAPVAHANWSAVLYHGRYIKPRSRSEDPYVLASDAGSLSGTTDAEGWITLRLEHAAEDPSRMSDKIMYRMDVSLTDAAGYTMRQSMQAEVPQATRYISVPDDDLLELDGLHKGLKVTVMGMDLKPVAATVHLQVHRLVPPDDVYLFHPLRNEEPDYSRITRDEWKRQFPGRVFENGQAEPTGIAETLLSSSLDVPAGGGYLPLPDRENWPAGLYEFRLCVVQDGDTLHKLSRRVNLGNSHSDEVPGRSPAWVQYNGVDSVFAIGDTVEVQIGSAGEGTAVFTDVWVKRPHLPGGATHTRRTLWTHGSSEKLRIPVVEGMQGGFEVKITFMKGEQVKSLVIPVKVAWGKPSLTATWLHRDDTLQPGRDHEWKLQVRDAMGRPVQAEVTAVMYDISLDYFNGNNWQGPWFMPNRFAGDYSRDRSRYPLHHFAYSVFNYRRQVFDVQAYTVLGSRLPYAEGLQDLYSEINSNLVKGKMEEKIPEYHSFLRGDLAPDIIVLRPGAGRQPDTLRWTAGNTPDEGSNTPAKEEDEKDEWGDEPYRDDWREDTHPLWMLPDQKTPRWLVQRSLGAPSSMGSATDVNTLPDFPARSLFRETAFFIPRQQTNANGEVTLRFRMTDDIGRYKVMLYCHTADMAWCQRTDTLLSVLPLQIEPFLPRVLRSGDSILIPVRVQNRTRAASDVRVYYVWRDAGGKDLVKAPAPARYAIPANGENNVMVSLRVPEKVVYASLHVWAEGSAGRDAWTQPVKIDPVLVNTVKHETFILDPGETKEIQPSWLKPTPGITPGGLMTLTAGYDLRGNAVRAMAWLTAFPHSCAEQQLHKAFAWELGFRYRNDVLQMDTTTTAVGEPRRTTATVGEPRRTTADTVGEPRRTTVTSPWEATLAADRKQELLFKTIIKESSDYLPQSGPIWSELKKMQLPSGALPWFPDGPADALISAEVLEGIAALDRLQALPRGDLSNPFPWTERIATCLGKELMQEMKQRLEDKGDAPAASPYLLRLCMGRLANISYHLTIPEEKAVRYWIDVFMEEYTSLPLRAEADLADCLLLTDQAQRAVPLLTHLKARSIQDADGLRHWPAPVPGEPVDEYAHIRIMEVMLSAGDTAYVQELLPWLLTQQRGNHWENTINTARVISLLLSLPSTPRSTQLFATSGDWQARLTNDKTGICTASFTPGGSTSAVGEPSRTTAIPTIRITNTGTEPFMGVLSQGVLTDERTAPAEGKLRIERKLFCQTKTSADWQPLTTSTRLHRGDRIRSELYITSNQQGQYLLLTDPRPSGCEPDLTLSGWSHQNGQSFYRVIRDPGTDMYLPELPPGQWIVSNTWTVSHAGRFSLPAAKCSGMYSPWVSGRSDAEGVRAGE